MKKFRKYRRIQPRYNRYSFQTWIDDNMEMLREIRPSFNFETASLNDYYNAFEELYIEHTSDCFCQMYSGQLDRFFYNLLFVNYITNKNIVFPHSLFRSAILLYHKYGICQYYIFIRSYSQNKRYSCCDCYKNINIIKQRP